MHLHKLLGYSLGLLFLSFHLKAANLPQGMIQLLSSQQELKLGADLYQRHCSGCHGNDGKGAGSAAQFLIPKPRNFIEGAFKFKATPYGSLPTRSDLLRVIERGIYGTSMPSFKILPLSQREAIATYVMSLREGWSEQVGATFEVPYPPTSFRNKETFLASALKGRKNYLELCASCHGDTGLGDGPASEGIVDGDNLPLKPANLRMKHLKSGSGSRDVFRVMSAGIEGSPMPPFGDSMSVEQRWEVVAYILFLRGQEEGIYSKDFDLEKVVSKK